MAVLMIPCSKLTDRWGRKRCFTWGLMLYGAGALISAVSPNLGVLILGNSVLEGVGTALLIPPVYILATLWFSDVTSRAWAFGLISGLGGIGAAAGPLLGGLITTAISWRGAFIFQAVVVAVIVLLSRRLEDPLKADPTRPFDAVGAILSAVGMFCIVVGILQAGTNNALLGILLVVGAAFLLAFFLYIRSRERAGKEALLSTALFKNRTCNLALVTQNIQWLVLLGTSFVVSVYLQEIRGYSAIKTGVVFTAATLGILASSLAAERLAKRFPQKTLIVTGFVVTIAGIVLLLVLVRGSDSIWAFVPGLALIGLGVGAMLTPSVNVVQSSFRGCKARSRGCLGISIWARRSARRSPASSSRSSPLGAPRTPGRWRCSQCSGSSGLWRPSSFPARLVPQTSHGSLLDPQVARKLGIVTSRPRAAVEVEPKRRFKQMASTSRADKPPPAGPSGGRT
jgi:MFS family permease